MKSLTRLLLGLLALLVALTSGAALATAPPAQNPQSGAIGLGGRISSAPPTSAPTITNPTNGTTFTSLPITVAGLCTSNLLVEVFKNNVFAGSAVCANNSYSLQIDLFGGQNQLIARQYDALNQVSPDSNTVTVTFNDQVASTVTRIILLSNYAVRGANPGSNLSWPLTLNGGTGPYAISVDWGDKSGADVKSLAAPGDFTINHTYSQAGVYSIVVKASDSKGITAFLQLVGIGNGPITIASNSTNGGTTTTKFIWWPLIILALLAISSFWLGSRHRLTMIRNKLRTGQRPF